MQTQSTDLLKYSDTNETDKQNVDVSLTDKLKKYQQNIAGAELIQGLDNIHHLITGTQNYTQTAKGNLVEYTKNRNLSITQPSIRLVISTLGRFSMKLDGQLITFRRKVQKRPLALLKAMIALGGYKISKTHLTSVLWPHTVGNARISIINTTIFRLRELIGKQAVIVENGCISINTKYCWVDSWEFEYVLNSNISSSDMINENLTKITELYNGDFLSEDVDSLLQLKKENLKNKMFSVLNRYCHWLIKNKDIDLAISLLEQCIRFDNLKEEYYLILMQCQVKKNLTQAALKTFNMCKKTLSSQLGVLPSMRCQKFYQTMIEK